MHCRDAIKGKLGDAGASADDPGGGQPSTSGVAVCGDSDNDGGEAGDDVAPLSLTAMHSDSIVDYGSDSDVPLLRGDSLVRRRSLIHLRESRRRDSIATMCASNVL